MAGSTGSSVEPCRTKRVSDLRVEGTRTLKALRRGLQKDFLRRQGLLSSGRRDKLDSQLFCDVVSLLSRSEPGVSGAREVLLQLRTDVVEQLQPETQGLGVHLTTLTSVIHMEVPVSMHSHWVSLIQRTGVGWSVAKPWTASNAPSREV